MDGSGWRVGGGRCVWEDIRERGAHTVELMLLRNVARNECGKDALAVTNWGAAGPSQRAAYVNVFRNKNCHAQQLKAR